MPLVNAYITHKKSELYSDCQDSYAISTDNKAIAIADGVSQSLFPKVWADMLTQAFVSDSDFTLNNSEKVQALRKRWKTYFIEELKRQQAANNPMVWKLENCFAEDKSAGATFVGLRFVDKHQVSYEILGDSCLVIVENKKIREVISSKENGDEFDNYPDYIDSSPVIGQKGVVKQGTFKFEKGMELLLVTDALSDILNDAFRSEDKGLEIVSNLTGLWGQDSFEECIEELRQKGMSNDDTTLVHVRWSKLNTIQVTYETPFIQYINNERSGTPTKPTIVKEAQVPNKVDNENTLKVNEDKDTDHENSWCINFINKLSNIFHKNSLPNIPNEEEEKYINEMIDSNRQMVVTLLREYLFGNKR